MTTSSKVLVKLRHLAGFCDHGWYLIQPSGDLRGTLLGTSPRSLNGQLRRHRRLVRVIEPGEVLDLAMPGPGVQSFDVSPLTLLERRRDPDLGKVPAQSAHEIS